MTEREIVSIKRTGGDVVLIFHTGDVERAGRLYDKLLSSIQTHGQINFGDAQILEPEGHA